MDDVTKKVSRLAQSRCFLLMDPYWISVPNDRQPSLSKTVQMETAGSQILQDFHAHKRLRRATTEVGGRNRFDSTICHDRW